MSAAIVATTCGHTEGGKKGALPGTFTIAQSTHPRSVNESLENFHHIYGANAGVLVAAGTEVVAPPSYPTKVPGDR